jgi:hypothetical protein
MNAVILTLVGVLGVGIAYFQWRTAHQRVLLDLFERRFAVYRDLRGRVGSVLLHGTCSPEQFIEFSEAKGRAQFLFGAEVHSFLERTGQRLADFGYLSSLVRDPPQHEQRHKLFESLEKFYGEFDSLVIPYLRLDQRMPTMWWPWRA